MGIRAAEMVCEMGWSPSGPQGQRGDRCMTSSFAEGEGGLREVIYVIRQYGPPTQLILPTSHIDSLSL
jgi:hypothetical protein